jgi:peptidoglycan/LPS O-acetylase OafA/YrhL
MGVDVFFVLSGFVLAHNYAHGAWTLPTYLSYIRKRFERIYPVHAFMLLVFVLAAVLPGKLLDAQFLHTIAKCPEAHPQ